MVAVEQMFRLDGKIAVITGASRGIGHALADALGRAGAACVGLARSAGPVTPFTSSVTYIPADITVDPVTVIDAVARQHSRIDILINAAGISLATTAPEMAMQVFDQTLQTNLRAAFVVSTAAARHMPPGSSIINVTSIGGHQGFPGNPAYVASKGGLRMLTQAMAVDLGLRGIRVNAIAPGYIHTDMTAISHADPVLHAQRAGRTCLGRWGEVDDLVGPALFLASSASSYMTGQDLVIDGGWTARGL